MGRLNKFIGALLLAALALLAPSALALSFQTDLSAIDTAAKSVLLLEVYDGEGQLMSTGSGFVVFDNQTLVTNNHVMEDAGRIIAYSDAGYKYMVTGVVAADGQNDIALLEFMSPTDMTPLPLRTEGKLMRGEPVVAIGSPKGVKNTVSLGNISAIYEEDGAHFIQFTAPISPGSSGGALFNDQGLVIGITTGALRDSQNMNLAVDIGEVVRLWEASKAKERVSFAEHRERALVPATPTPEIESAAVTMTPTPIPLGLGKADNRVFDYAGLFTKNELSRLEGLIAAMRVYYPMDFVVLTSEKVPEGEEASQDFANSFYDGEGFGKSPDYSGLLLLIDMSNRIITVSTTGDMITLIPDARLDSLLDRAFPYLDEGKFGQAAYSVLNELMIMLDSGMEEPGPEPTKTPDPTPTPAPTPTSTPTPAPMPAEEVVIGFELQAMWTYEGVVLRWEKVANAEYYALYRKNGEDGTVDFMKEVPGSQTYYLDSDATAADSSTGYMLMAVVKGNVTQNVFANIAEVEPQYSVSGDLKVPADFQAYAVVRPMLSWRFMPNARYYALYRGESAEGPYTQVCLTDLNAFYDYGAAPGGTYYYKIRSTSGDLVSKWSEPLYVRWPESFEEPVGKAPGEDDNTLVIGEYGYVSDYMGYPRLKAGLVNNSRGRVITGFTLAYYCHDEDGKDILNSVTGEKVYEQRFDMILLPQQEAYASYAWLYGCRNAKDVYVAVAGVSYLNGDVVHIQEEERDYYYWTLD